MYNVTALDFAAWLAAQGEPPSPHIAAWIEAAQAVIEPPDSWRVQSEFGMLRFDATPAGRLVRLADLVQWLMDKNEWPCGVATEKVCDALLSGGVDDCLYLLQSGRYAKVLDSRYHFDWVPMVSFGGGTTDSDKEHCGLHGAVKCMRMFWGSSAAPSASEYACKEVLDPLTIRVDKANQLWGYGHVPTTHEAVPQVAAPVAPVEPIALTPEAIKGGAGKNKRAEWTEEALTLIQCAFAKAKKDGEKLADVAERFGLSRQAFSGAATRGKKATRSGATQALTVVTNAANRSATR